MSFFALCGWVGVFLTVSGLYLAGRKSIWCWPVWIVSNVLWIVSEFPGGSFTSLIACNVCMLLINIRGWWAWARTQGDQL